MSTILSLAPQNVWKHFYSLTQVPRPSGYLKKVQEFLLNFGKSVGVESFQDEAGNIIYRKPATPGMEFFRLTWTWFLRRITIQCMILKMILSRLTLTEIG